MRKRDREKSNLTIVGDSTLKVDGNIESESSIIVSGEITGDVTVKTNTAVISDVCTVMGNITAEVAEIRGTVYGNIKATRTIIRSGGYVEGDINTEVIAVDEGGTLNGNCKTANNRKEEKAE